jgi:hypothetical protein
MTPRWETYRNRSTAVSAIKETASKLIGTIETNIYEIPLLIRRGISALMKISMDKAPDF